MTTSKEHGRRYEIRFADPGDRELVARFNERVAGGGLQYQFPLDARLPGEANGGEDLPVFRKLMIIEDGQEMRAGVLLHHSTIFVRGDERPFCWSLLPISEGAVQDGDPLAMLILMRRALEYQPFLTGLGVGSMDEDAAQYLVRLRWKNEPVPFVFYPVRPTRLLRGLRYLRRKPLLRIASAVAAYSGAAAAFGWGWNRRRRRRAARVGFRFDTVPVFGEWADRLFERNCAAYGAVVRRDAAALNVLYREGDSRYHRLRVRDGRSGDDLGWIVTIDKKMQDDDYFGNLHVGTLVDGFGHPDATEALVASGLEHLAGSGVDVVVANWSHREWVDASRSLGFVAGPSNFFFFVSAAGAPLLESGCPLTDIHLTRGDGDGPGGCSPTREPLRSRPTANRVSRQTLAAGPRGPGSGAAWGARGRCRLRSTSAVLFRSRRRRIRPPTPKDPR